MPNDYVEPTREQLERFSALPRDEPIEIMNLIRFRARAAYPDDHPAAREGLTGAEAYARYSVAAKSLFTRAGGRVVWAGAPQVLLIGPADETWDTAFIVQYRDAAAFLEEANDPVYHEAAKHRDAAVLDQRAIRCAPREDRENFG